MKNPSSVDMQVLRRRLEAYWNLKGDTALEDTADSLVNQVAEMVGRDVEAVRVMMSKSGHDSAVAWAQAIGAELLDHGHGITPNDIVAYNAGGSRPVSIGLVTEVDGADITVLLMYQNGHIDDRSMTLLPADLVVLGTEASVIAAVETLVATNRARSEVLKSRV